MRALEIMPVEWLQLILDHSHHLVAWRDGEEQEERRVPRSSALSSQIHEAARDAFITHWQRQHFLLDGSITDPTSSTPANTTHAYRAAKIHPLPVTKDMPNTSFSPPQSRKSRSNHGMSSLVTSAPVSAMSTIARDVRAMEDMRAESQHAVDPLSSYIMKRKSAAPVAVSQQSTRRSSSEDTTSMRTDYARSTRSPSRSGQRPEISERAREDLKKGVKAVSFLSRLMGNHHHQHHNNNNKRRSSGEKAMDTISLTSDAQVEGNEAEVFAQSRTGYNLRTSQAPDYIKVRSRFKERREFDKLFLAQELQCSNKRRLKLTRTNSSKLIRRKSSATSDFDTVWAMEFSRDGMHLAAAGADAIVRVWKVLSSTEDRKTHEKQESSGPDVQEHLNAPVFQSQAVREYAGHEAPVLDLSWSKNNFLISSSMDKTVRLWHLSRVECLCTFRHNDFVPSIAFHPKDDQFFLTGSLDSKLRLWNIAEKTVAYSISVPDMITAVTFMPDGKLAVAGTLNGSCYWYETEGLKYKTQLQIRPDKGTGVSGPKITSLQAAQGRGGDKVLVTSNDSKIRLYNIRDKGCEMVFKGNVNDSSQIRGSLSDDGRYVVCGSEDYKAYIWSVTPTESGKLDKKPVECFDAHTGITTAVCIAPASTRRLLAQSEDPIYDLASSSPPSNLVLARTESHGSSRPPTEMMPLTTTDGDTPSLLQRTNSVLVHNGYKNGNIIVTADYAGKIKVFRQDCASHRRQQDEGDRSSSLFRRGDRSSLASSLQTKSSQRSLRDAKNLAMSQVASSDRIMTWRQEISSTPTTTTHQGSPTPASQSRETSPNTTQSRGSQSEAYDTATSAESPSTVPTSTGSVDRTAVAVVDTANAAKDEDSKQESDNKTSHQDLLALDGQRSYAYYNKNKAIEAHARAQQMFQGSMGRLGSTGDKNPLHHAISFVSRLSDDVTPPGDIDSDDEHFADAMEHPGSPR